MVFDITDLDKIQLIQAVYAYAFPINLSVSEYEHRKEKGENVEGLSINECKEILYEAKTRRKFKEYVQILDYHKGKRLKLDFEYSKENRISVNCSNYDSGNGKYRFFEALIDFFPIEDILILNKEYSRFDGFERENKRENELKKILDNTVRIEIGNKNFWKLPKDIYPFKL